MEGWKVGSIKIIGGVGFVGFVGSGDSSREDGHAHGNGNGRTMNRKKQVKVMQCATNLFD